MKCALFVFVIALAMYSSYKIVLVDAAGDGKTLTENGESKDVKSESVLVGIGSAVSFHPVI